VVQLAVDVNAAAGRQQVRNVAPITALAHVSVATRRTIFAFVKDGRRG
jgi:hypothetical protein